MPHFTPLTLASLQKFLRQYALEHAPTTDLLVFYATANRQNLVWTTATVDKQLVEVVVSIRLETEILVNLQLKIAGAVQYQTLNFVLYPTAGDQRPTAMIESFNQALANLTQVSAPLKSPVRLQGPVLTAFLPSQTKVRKLIG